MRTRIEAPGCNPPSHGPTGGAAARRLLGSQGRLRGERPPRRHTRARRWRLCTRPSPRCIARTRTRRSRGGGGRQRHASGCFPPRSHPPVYSAAEGSGAARATPNATRVASAAPRSHPAERHKSHYVIPPHAPLHDRSRAGRLSTRTAAQTALAPVRMCTPRRSGRM